jgi:hypothetical protein
MKSARAGFPSLAVVWKLASRNDSKRPEWRGWTSLRADTIDWEPAAGAIQILHRDGVPPKMACVSELEINARRLTNRRLK